MKIVKKIFGMLLIYSFVMIGTYMWMWRIDSLENNNEFENAPIVYNIG